MCTYFVWSSYEPGLQKFAYILPPRSILKTTNKKQLTLINKISRKCRYSEYQWFSDKPLHRIMEHKNGAKHFIKYYNS